MPQTLPHPKKVPAFRLAWSLPLAVAGTLALTGCASTPEPPERALAAAEQAISTAEQARVADYASPELGEARRNLTAATVQGNYAVVGDIEGYLHWLNLQDGAFAARARAGSDAIRGQPVVADGLLVVETTGGELSAWRISP